MNYANLRELIENHPYSIETFASHANVTVDLLKAALDGKEELTPSELCGIVRLTGFPYSALTCPKLILMDNKRYRHRMLASELNDKLRSIIKAAGTGSHEAIRFTERHWWNYEDGTTPFWTDFVNGVPVSYARYWCGKRKMDDCLNDIQGEKHARPVRGLMEATSAPEGRASKKSEYLSDFLKNIDELQRFTAAHGKKGMLWGVFESLSCLIGEYMMESKNRGEEVLE